MSEVVISLNIAADEYLKLYKGSARSVFTQTVEGRSIRFPANILQPFVTREGVRGRFIIEFDEQNKFRYIKRL